MDSFAVGQQVGCYQIEGRLGAGGMGIVYLANDRDLGRRVAIKVVDSTRPDASLRRALLEEARAAAALNHPSICSVHGFGRLGNEPFIVMEHVEGKALLAMIPEGIGLPIETALHYAIQIADALVHAHAHGIVHGDLKTGNVMVTPEGRAKILDFGLSVRPPQAAASTDAQTTYSHDAPACAGTVAYMAPELLRGRAAGVRSDIWAFGVLCYEMLAGRRPFRGGTAYEIAAGILGDTPNPFPARVPSLLRAIVSRCLSKEPANRYASAAEVGAALDDL